MLHGTDNTHDHSAPHSESQTPGRWLLVIYRVPTEPSSARSAIWRETRRLGALPLQHAVWVLPLSDASQAACTRLAQRIEEYGGEATILETRSPDAVWQAKIVGRFNAARDEEYEEVVDESERFCEEVARERRKGKFTFAELEDEESNLERLRRYLAQVQARDVFGATGQAAAMAAVEHCATVLEAFAHEVYQRQHEQESEPADGPIRRVQPRSPTGGSPGAAGTGSRDHADTREGRADGRKQREGSETP